MGSGQLAGCLIVVVEDDPLISVDVQSALREAGATIVAATDTTDAVRLVASSKLSAAVLDVDLGDLDCWVVCRLLARGNVPFAFYTGYTQSQVFTDWPDAPVLAKPASHRQLIAAVTGLLRGARTPGVAGSPASAR